jgi:hypothetical protein
MAQADSHNTTAATRRRFLSKAAGVAAGSAVLAMAPAYPAPAMKGIPDPILEAIEGHRVAYAAFDAAVRRNGKLDDEFIDRRRSQTNASEEAIVRTDDPRWIESETELARTSEAETDAAIRLVDIRPTTVGGIMALLEYVLLCERRGDDGWPDELVDENDKPRTWHHFLLENLAVALTLEVSA